MFGKIILSQWLCVSAMLGMSSCNDDEVINQSPAAPLQVGVNTQGNMASRAIIHDEYLPDASAIGISLFTPEGEDYDNQGYLNIKYIASGTGESQTWDAQGTTPSISANEAYLLAYYPHNPDVETKDDLAALPVENASQTDYMYAGLMTGITNANPKVNITMQHALTAIHINLVLGDFTGDATVSFITVKSPGLASAATLNIADGSLDNISGQGSEFAMDADFVLSAGGTANDVLFVPDAAVTEGTTTVSATIGGNKYTAAIEFDEAYKQGYIYTYTLTLNNSGFAVTKVNVNPWKPGTDDDAVLEPEVNYEQDEYVVKILIKEDNMVYIHNVQDMTGVIDWGDGTVDSYDILTTMPEHTYTAAGTYVVKLKGNLDMITSYVTGYSHDGYIKELIHIGNNLGITSIKGAFFGNPLLDKIHPDAIKGLNVKSLSDVFQYCSNLQEIPQGLFDNCTEVTDFHSAFYGCERLQTIPVGLFDKCIEVTDFWGTFGGCSNLQTIPVGLFDNCTKVTTFSQTFWECTALQTIPEGLFDHCTEVTSFNSTFDGCESLTEIPEGLFDKCKEVTDFSGTFSGCISLTAIPESLFKNNVKVTEFERTFLMCSNLTTIPEGLFKYNTEVTTFKGVFAAYYAGVKATMKLNSIPATLFDYNTKVTSFEGAFNQCNNLTGESPYTVINVDGVDTKVHLYERSAYPDYFTAPKTRDNCFYNCTGLTDYDSIPEGWK